MSSTKITPSMTIAEEAIHAFDDLGSQPGFRPTHAKGILLAGRFIPAAKATGLTRAPHILRTSTPVTVRFSVGTGIPVIPDNDPHATPRGMAIRFHLAEHVHTDIIAHSVNGMPSRTAEEFVELLRAIYASAQATAKPTPLEMFLGTHPAAVAFLQKPKPLPISFIKESYYAVNAYRFVNADNAGVYGRYQVRPDGNNEYFDDAEAAKQPVDVLFDDVKERLTRGAVKMRVEVQVAAPGDTVDDSTVQWPADRPIVDFGTIELMSVIPNNDAEQRHIIFDPIPRVDGIEPSGDPLLEPRAATYLMSGRRRRAQGAKEKTI